MRVTEVPINAVLAEDILWKRKMLVAKGSILTDRILALLSRRNIQYAYIKQNMGLSNSSKSNSSIVFSPTLEAKTTRQDLSMELDILNSIVVQESAVVETKVGTQECYFSNQYLHALAELNTEIRYGRSLKNSEEIDFVRSLFVSYMHQEQYRACLNDLNKRDHYTYLHAIDVFTLSILFMRKQGVQNCEEIGIGILLHDVGKLKTPVEVLKKRGKLTKPEFELMKQHTTDGHDILCHLGASHVAYLALSHHERIDGSGYPHKRKLMELPEELRILQLVDMYSAITLTRSYKCEQSVTEAMTLLFQEKHTLDENILMSFIDFIGIYPEKSLVLLSNGSHATVEKVNELYPLLPTVRVFETGVSFTLPLDFQVTIQKLISYHVDTPEQLFVKFSDYLINSDDKEMEAYYEKLKEHYRTFEWFTHLYIPVYQIFHVLKTQKVVEESRLNRSGQQLSGLLRQTIVQLRQLNHKKSHVLLVVDTTTINANVVALLEGILHTEGLYSIVMNYTTNPDVLQNRLEEGQFTHLVMLGDKGLPIIGADKKIDIYHFTEKNLQQMLFHFASIRPLQVSVLQEMSKYKMVQSLILQ